MTKTDDIDRPRVSQLLLFPLLISLEGCAMDVTKGHHKEVFHALYSFSDEEMYKKRKPHLLKKGGGAMKKWFKKSINDQIISIDIKSNTPGRGVKRLLYTKAYRDTTMYCKILALCTEDSHTG